MCRLFWSGRVARIGRSWSGVLNNALEMQQIRGQPWKSCLISSSFLISDAHGVHADVG